MTTESIAPAVIPSIRDAILSRRSIRKFSDRHVGREVMEELLADAVWAPSPHNAQPWRFTVLFSSEEKERLAEAMAARLAEELCADGLSADEVDRQTLRSRRRISTAPAVVLCSLVRDGLVRYADARRDALEWQMAVQSMGAVLQTLFLLAADRGLGSCWMAAPMYCPEVVRAALELPDHFSPQALVLLGYATQPGRVRARRTVAEVVELR
jgi:coenzyme F420-0:L-glutamate ligase/coenzyme F420-1:gamma-L-glutamate ligase